MADIDNIQIRGGSAQPGFLTPMDAYGGLYDNPGYTEAVGKYYDAMGASGANERANLIESNTDKVMGIFGAEDKANVRHGIAKGEIGIDANGLPYVKDPRSPNAQLYTAIINKAKEGYWSSDTDILRNSAKLQNLAQREASTAAERAQALQGQSAFRQEMGRLEKNMVAPNLMTAYMQPGLAQANQSALATANAAGGGSLGQAASRRAAMSQFGQTSAGLVPQAVAKQGELDVNMKQAYEKQRAGMIQNNFQNQMAASQQRYQQNMQQQAYEKALEEYAHTRNMEYMKMGFDVLQSGSKAFTGAGSMAGG